MLNNSGHLGRGTLPSASTTGHFQVLIRSPNSPAVRTSISTWTISIDSPKGAIDEKNGNLPRAVLGDALAIANSVWNVCTHNEQPLPDTSDDWVTVAINRTSGYLMDFYFDALRSVWQTRDQEQQLIQSILEALREMIEGDSPASEIARVLVPANALLLAAMAPDWYGAHVLPLLSETASPRSSEQ